MEFSSEAGRFTLFPNGKATSTASVQKHSCTRARVHLCIRALVLSLSALLQRFPVYLSWHIQSMNAQSQQVWTQLLNIQLPPLTISAFSHLKLSRSLPLLLLLLCLQLRFFPSLFRSLQLCHCHRSLLSTFIKGFSSDSPSYNT